MIDALKLTSDMLTYVPAIDEQHQELINRINSLLSLGLKAGNEETEKTLDFLGSYVIKHFGDEEVLHLQSGYPKRAEHHAFHQKFIDTFKKLRADYLQKGNSLQFTQQLDRSIINWIVQHIRGADVDFGKFVNSQKQQTACCK
jgi:hemerythrin